MEGFEDKAEECGLFPESDWELLEVIEKGSQEEVSFGKRLVLLSTVVWLRRANGLMQDTLAVFPACGAHKQAVLPSCSCSLCQETSLGRLGLCLQIMQNAGYSRA